MDKKKAMGHIDANPFKDAMVEGADLDVQAPQSAQQRADSLRDQIANRPAFSYDPNTDPLWGAMKDQYMHAGKRAMEDTIGQAAGLSGGYANTYAQSAGQQSYEEYLTKLNAELPAAFDRARSAYDKETADLYNLYNLELNQANLDYNRSRDELADQRYEDELAYSRGRDELADQRYADELAYGRSRDELADQRYADELAYGREQTAQNRAYDMAMQMIATGQTPSNELLAQAGIDATYAKNMAGYYSKMLTATGGSGSSGGSSRRSSGGYRYTGDGTKDGTTPQGVPLTSQYTDSQIAYAYGAVEQAIKEAIRSGDITYAVTAYDKYADYFPDNKKYQLIDLMDRADKTIEENRKKQQRQSSQGSKNGNKGNNGSRSSGGGKWVLQTK